MPHSVRFFLFVYLFVCLFVCPYLNFLKPNMSLTTVARGMTHMDERTEIDGSQDYSSLVH
jgi:hypothetical protein